MAGVPRWQARAGGWLPCQQAANYTSCSLVWLVLVSEVSASTCGVMRWRLAALGASSGGAKSSHGPGLGGEVGLGAGQPPGRVEGGGDEQAAAAATSSRTTSRTRRMMCSLWWRCLRCRERGWLRSRSDQPVASARCLVRLVCVTGLHRGRYGRQRRVGRLSRPLSYGRPRGN